METVQTEKTFKLPVEMRAYHCQKWREKNGWVCARCGDKKPIYKNIETKEKLCLNCAIRDCVTRKKKEENKNATA